MGVADVVHAVEASPRRHAALRLDSPSLRCWTRQRRNRRKFLLSTREILRAPSDNNSNRKRAKRYTPESKSIRPAIDAKTTDVTPGFISSPYQAGALLGYRRSTCRLVKQPFSQLTPANGYHRHLPSDFPGPGRYQTHGRGFDPTAPPLLKQSQPAQPKRQRRQQTPAKTSTKGPYAGTYQKRLRGALRGRARKTNT